jgi:nicotinate dehydrogenase subunit B
MAIANGAHLHKQFYRYLGIFYRQAMLDTVKPPFVDTEDNAGALAALAPVRPPPAAPPKLPGSLQTNRRLDQWLAFGPGRTVRIRTGKVEIGQGILTALLLIAAEELDLPPASVQIESATTASGPDEGVTAGSLSVQYSGGALRHACAEVRSIALRKAASAHGIAADQLTVSLGDILLPNGSKAGDYWQWLAPTDLAVEASSQVRTKPHTAFTVVGKGMTRIDLHDKVFGKARFIHDLRLPGMVHGRIVRPPSRSAQLVTVKPEAVEAMAGVLKVVVDGRFLAVIAEGEHTAVKAAEALVPLCEWRESPDLPDQNGLAAFLTSAPAVTTVPYDTSTPETPETARAAQGLVQHQAEYLKAFHAHGSIGPSCGVALWNGSELQVWSNSQAIHNLRDDLVHLLAHQGFPVPEENITVRHTEGAGAYGHNGADDVAGDAVLLALAWPGAPVRVLWSRADELTWSPMGSAQLVRLNAALDANGMIRQWQTEIWANGYACRPGRSNIPTLLGSGHCARGQPAPISLNMPYEAGGGADRNSVPFYDIPSVKAITHRLDVMPIRTSSIRGLGAYPNGFAIESFMDELALAHGIDPIDFRRRHLQHNPRALAVLEKVVEQCSWWNDTAGRGEGIGHGFAVARYKTIGAWCAIAARVDCGEKVQVTHMEIAVDVGQVIDPDGVRNQVEGGAIQSASWALMEQLSFDDTRLTSNGWDSYPIMRFSDVPQVRVHLIDRPECEPIGAGEAVQGPAAGAIANAVADALGMRVRRLPLTQDNIMAAMDD